MRILVALISLALTPVTNAGAEVPAYTEFQLQVRSNIVDGFNLPANSSFNSKTPSLNDFGQVSVCLSVVGGDSTLQGIWLGGGGSGSVVFTDPNDGFISDCSLNNSGDVVAELRGFFVSPEGLYLYDSGIGTAAFWTNKPLGATGWGSPTLNSSVHAGFKASFDGDYAWVSFDGSADAVHAAMVDIDVTSPYSYLFTPAFNDSGLIAGKVRFGAAGQIADSQPDQIVIIDSGGNATVIVEDQDSDGSSPFVAFDNGVWLTENGRVAFVAEKPSGARAVFLSDGATTVEIASEEDAEVSEIEYFHPVANDAGLVAFRGKDAAGLQAVFVGDGVDFVRVIGEHDLVTTDLGGGRIDQHDGSVVFGGALSINAGGDIAFSAGLTPEDDNQIEWGSGIFIAVGGGLIFADGFESGDSTGW
ncbi:MAG: hypothetical protein ABFS37_06930 [Acidobacteriota bacterium]